MGNHCGGGLLEWCWGSSDDNCPSPRQPPRPKRGPSSDSLLRNVQNPHVNALLAVEHDAKLNFRKTFVLGRKLGKGSFATVYECGEIATKKTYACKVYDRNKLDAATLECALTEPYLLRRMYHPGILRCQGFYKEDDMYVLVMEELRGGDIFDKLRETKSHIQERDMCRLVKMFLEALVYIHKRNIVHRDLKLENLMLESTSENACLKIVDFGFAIQVPSDEPTLTEVLGTPGYMAPEIIRGGPYGKPVDVWSAGVIVYTLLCGYPPFHHDRVSNVNTLFRAICYGYYFFDSPYWNDISDDAKDLISKMLQVDPTARATAEQLLEHAWFTQQQPPLPASPRAQVNTLKIIGSLRSFNRILKARVAEHKLDAASHHEELTKLAHEKIQALDNTAAAAPVVDLAESTLLPATRYSVQ
ncbi:Aste57867_10557 [Aphanomyces stellatus]|uniref:Aste57867_10557 protein n=1 Tax=Aphanomyces stellatus TaxID=120398 RepID=A0A485KQS4_9STRA|nr:hypothetical protein As57867_010517 [Aphanomyces stellatus]VFT87430.1 Aste57867_10557 [Aphanomyces stellatus]